MGRRLALLGIGLAFAGVTTGCPVDPAASPPPAISSITATPAPAVAGGPLSIEVHAGHPDGIFEAHVVLLTRTDGFLGSQHQCASAGAQPAVGSGTAAVVTITCTLPAGIQNTVWTARVNVTSNAGTVAFADVPFAVVGGSEDYAGPVVTTVGGLPGPIAPGGAAQFVVRATDDHLPLMSVNAWILREGGQLGEPTLTCSPGTPAPVDATSVDVTFSCLADALAPVGTYHVQIHAVDDLSQMGTLAFDPSVA